MFTNRLLAMLCAVLLSGFSGSLLAGDFDWLKSFSLSISKNESGYSSRLATRFRIGDVQLKSVIRDSGGKADAYMVLRLAEMSHQPVKRVIREYRRHKGAWGKLAKSLGIKPGSKAFHALKRGHDLGDQWQKPNPKANTRHDPKNKRHHPANKSFKHKKSGRPF